MSNTSTGPAIAARANYGGQAVVEGVMIRGPHAVATAVRKPDGEIAVRSRPLGGLYSARLRRVPLLRGVLVLWETLALGISSLTWSSAVASDEVDEHGEAKLGSPATRCEAAAVRRAGPSSR